ncbi:hypothetical protein P27p09 [Enterobacteria phage phiP27]|uniref:hypothetical protein n=1 Tax=Enterobacteria phage phiP27 TaxID=103807 RepID=UPI000009B3AC|nr:hypothetical protein P27p09 [Enterobacteria phage phiP27]CAC83527.1 hypothetical protein [Enterobacteria phage phiP27]
MSGARPHVAACWSPFTIQLSMEDKMINEEQLEKEISALKKRINVAQSRYLCINSSGGFT